MRDEKLATWQTNLKLINLEKQRDTFAGEKKVSKNQKIATHHDMFHANRKSMKARESSAAKKEISSVKNTKIGLIFGKNSLRFLQNENFFVSEFQTF